MTEQKKPKEVEEIVMEAMPEISDYAEFGDIHNHSVRSIYVRGHTLDEAYEKYLAIRDKVHIHPDLTIQENEENDKND